MLIYLCSFCSWDTRCSWWSGQPESIQKRKEGKTLLSLVWRRVVAISMLIYGLQADGSLRVERKFVESGVVCTVGLWSVCEYRNG